MAFVGILVQGGRGNSQGDIPMTAFDYIYLMNEFEIKLLSGFTVHFSFVSAFLVASYVAAHRLNLRMFGIVNAVYTIMTLYTGLQIFSGVGDMAYLARAAMEADAAGLIELPRTTLISNTAVPTYRAMAYGFIVITLVIYAASLVFAFGVRRAALAREAEAVEVDGTEPEQDA